MRKLLFVINSLDGGGAEKSLISLLNELEVYKDHYEIDLLMPNKKGLFVNQVPSFVYQVTIPKALYYMANGYRELVKQRAFNIKFLWKKLQWTMILKKYRKQTSGIKEQLLWKVWKKQVMALEKEYDVAIGYLNGYPNYFVCDKVKAKKRILWLHNEYQKIGYDTKYDRSYYEKADAIVTISELCKEKFLEAFPQYREKVFILENISSGKMIQKMAGQGNTADMQRPDNAFIFLSIGRLVEQKNFKLAIDTAAYLRKKYLDFQFQWYIIGQGPLLNILKEYALQKKVNSFIHFLGVKENPYPYIKKADLLIQTSLFEGKSIVLDEAKILGKTIIATNYNTVYNSLKDGETGYIREQCPEAIGEQIYLCCSQTDTLKELQENLKAYASGNTKEIKKYLLLFEK